VLLLLASAGQAEAQVYDDQGTLMQSAASPPPPTSSSGARRLAAPAVLTLPTGVAVGRTAGTFGVSSTGMAQYSMPLWTPGGIAGLQPSLSLSYASTFGNGMTGIGWALGGVSSISRCYKSVAQNGVAGSADLAATDVFCLDGNMLRSFSGTYGADGSQYQTEVADFSLVISHGTAGVGPAWFEVYAKNGLIYEYGNLNAGQTTAHAALLAAGSSSVLEWSQRQCDRLDELQPTDHDRRAGRIYGVRLRTDASVLATDLHRFGRHRDDVLLREADGTRRHRGRDRLSALYLRGERAGGNLRSGDKRNEHASLRAGGPSGKHRVSADQCRYELRE
jgi:hypothetical protein